MRTNRKVQRAMALASFAQAFFASQATAQGARESRDDVVRQRCVAVISAIGRTVSAENASQLRELRDCDESSAPLLARLWTEPLREVSVVNALIGASSDVRDARTAAAALAVVESES